MPVDPLDLFFEVTDSSGTTYQWGANRPPGFRLQNFSFRTKLGEGFSDASGSLTRRIDWDYPDLELLNDVKVVGGDGSIAYEGRLSALPREIGDSHSIGVQIAGYMAHTKDRSFREVYVDRDLGAWGPMSQARREAMLSSNFVLTDADSTADPTDNAAAVSTHFEGGWVSPFKPLSEAWYDAGPGVTIGVLKYGWKRGGTQVGTLSPWTWDISLASDDKATSSTSSGTLVGAGPSSGQTLSPTDLTRRYAFVRFSFTSTPASTDGAPYAIIWTKLAVYGAHGLPLFTGVPNEPEGVHASDVIKNIAGRFCPLLNTDGVENTGYVIHHLVFKDLTDPYDAFLQVNKYHLWHLGVWDNKTLTFRPHDLTDYQWEVRTDDEGTTFSPQGPTSEDLHNGMVVTFTDVLKNTRDIVTPDDDGRLVDSSSTNPWNKWGVRSWGKIELSAPTMREQAIEIGRAALAQANAPKAPGTVTVRGYVRDRAGNPQPAWKIRAGDTIGITNFPNDAPRLIHETSYDNDSKTNTLSVDAPAQALDAVLDRIGTALEAANLS